MSQLPHRAVLVLLVGSLASACGRQLADEGSVPPRATIAPLPTPLPWSGSVIASVLAEGPGQSIALYDADGRFPAVRLTEGFDSVEAPAWSPDGGALAFAGDRNGNWDLYQIGRDGTGLRRLTSHAAFDGWPAWSPSGDALAFVSSREDGMAVYRLALDTGELSVERLSAVGGTAIEPAWSPDGRWIAYAMWSDGAYDLEAVESTGGTPRLVAASSAAADLRAPAWSPDGARLSYLEQRHGVGRLIVRGWSPVRGEAVGGVTTVAAEVLGYAWFPGGEAVAVVVAGRSGNEVQIRTPGVSGSWPVARLAPGPTQLSWTRGPLPTGLAAAAIDRTPTPMATSVAGWPGIARLPDVAAPGDRINAGLLADFEALRSVVRLETGRDFLGTLADLWRPLGYNGTGSTFFSWHKTGRAFDTQMEFRGAGRRQDMVLVREDADGHTKWRMFLRAGAQDGSAGRPLIEPGWSFSAGSGSEDDAQAGGRRAAVLPGGYWVDFTDLAGRYGWQRIASLSRGSVDWRRDWEGIEYWHYERRDGLRWFQAVEQLYTSEELAAELDPDRLRALDVPIGRLARLGFPAGWANES